MGCHAEHIQLEIVRDIGRGTGQVTTGTGEPRPPEWKLSWALPWTTSWDVSWELSWGVPEGLKAGKINPCGCSSESFRGRSRGSNFAFACSVRHPDVTANCGPPPNPSRLKCAYPAEFSRVCCEAEGKATEGCHTRTAQQVETSTKLCRTLPAIKRHADCSKEVMSVRLFPSSINFLFCTLHQEKDHYMQRRMQPCWKQ